MRISDEIDGDKFNKYVAKYVRSGHVQNTNLKDDGTPQHWKQAWQQAKLK